MWPLLFACAAPPEPPPPVVEAAPVAPAVWTLLGRASSEGLDTPALVDGAVLLGPRCATLNAALKGDGPPCFVEDWSAGADPVRVERTGARLRFDHVPGRTSWTPIAGTLASCLGDPLAVPPAADPVGRRTLDGRTWVVGLSGKNRCALAGTLRLDVTRDRADWSELSAGGLPWARGGREAAQATLRAELRALVATRWADLDAEARDDARRGLAEDPHPDARRLLDTHR